MHLNQRSQDGVVILEPVGPITIGDGDVKLRQAVLGTLQTGAKHISIDLKKATAADSSGIAELVAAHSTVKSHGGSLNLVNLPPKIHDVLGVTRLITVFDIYDHEDEAIAAHGVSPMPAMA